MSAWKHLEDHPGYFITEDGLKQMMMTKKGTFVVTETAPHPKGGHEILRGPFRDPARLGIPKALLDEAEEKTIDECLARLTAGEDVTIDITSLARSARPRSRR